MKCFIVENDKGEKIAIEVKQEDLKNDSVLANLIKISDGQLREYSNISLDRKIIRKAKLRKKSKTIYDAVDEIFKRAEKDNNNIMFEYGKENSCEKTYPIVEPLDASIATREDYIEQVKMRNKHLDWKYQTIRERLKPLEEKIENYDELANFTCWIFLVLLVTFVASFFSGKLGSLFTLRSYITHICGTIASLVATKKIINKRSLKKEHLKMLQEQMITIGNEKNKEWYALYMQAEKTNEIDLKATMIPTVSVYGHKAPEIDNSCNYKLVSDEKYSKGDLKPEIRSNLPETLADALINLSQARLKDSKLDSADKIHDYNVWLEKILEEIEIPFDFKPYNIQEDDIIFNISEEAKNDSREFMSSTLKKCIEKDLSRKSRQ